jgi:serpin B
MKTIKYVILIIIIGSLISCEKEKTNNADEAPELKLTKSGELLVESGNNFGFELLNVINQESEDDENLFISPLSISFAFGMALNGAEGETYDEIAQTFHFEDLSREEINENYESIIGGMKALDNNVVMNIANSMWNKEGFPIKQNFIDVNQEYFDAEVENLDFTAPESVDVINNWVKDKTNNKIEEVIDAIPANAVMYLINAIYFNGTWKYEFDEEHTTESNFYLENGSVLDDVMFMKQEAKLRYTENDIFTGVELPYGNGAYSMYVLLPNDNVSTEDLLEEFGENGWDTYNEQFDYDKDVHVEIPKLKFSYDRELKKDLMALGMEKPFLDADFSRISDVALLISRVIHKSFVEINEEGTEAAAVTAIEFRYTSAGDGDQKDLFYFNANKPFVFVIQENSSKTVLFIGKVKKPVIED